MKAQELRIGNCLQRLDGSVFQVNEHDFKILIHDLPEHLHPKSIPLTEEWLLSFGFQKHESKLASSYSISINPNKTFLKELVVFINKGNEYIHIREGENPFPSSVDSIMTLLNGDYHGRPFYVHQLQNLFFALTGEELTIKENDIQTN